MNPIVANIVSVMLLIGLPMASIIVAFLIYRELRLIRKIRQEHLGYFYIVELMRWRKKFYSPRTSRAERLVAKVLIAQIEPCLKLKGELPRP